MFFIIRGNAKKSSTWIAVGATLFIGTVLFFGFLDFWGEMLWFKALGYGERFWTAFVAKAGSAAAAGALGGIAVLLLTYPIPVQRRRVKMVTAVIGVLGGGLWGLSNWETILQYFSRASTGLSDPVFQKNTGFYFFVLPFYQASYHLILFLAGLSLAGVFVSRFIRFDEGAPRLEGPGETGDGEIQAGALYRCTAALLLVLAWGNYLDRFLLMYSELGVVTGPGWTDVHVKIPAYTTMVIILGATAFLLLLPPIRGLVIRTAAKFGTPVFYRPLAPVILLGLLNLAAGFTLLNIAPAAFQWLRVEPNEVTFERPYIINNIRFTRNGFHLHNIEEKEYPASDRFSSETVAANDSLFSNIRLWDHRALDAVYKQFQEIRLYYEFSDVDIDRYTIDGAYRQVMVSARELAPDNLPPESRTFVNRRFKYTHGYGMTMTPVNEFTPEGLPDLIIKDIPPVSRASGLNITTPQIYYGELTRNHVVANSREEELDYPKGEKNVYTHYDGNGGVALNGLWRKFLYGWKFDGTRFFLSGYPTRESRVLFHRQIQERLNELAPFLRFDNDPYIVLADGRLYWIVDAYTTSRRFPYSAPFRPDEGLGPRQPLYQTDPTAPKLGHFSGINYMRNSVKAVVDAYHGTVDFYVFEPEDPLIQVWRRIFPDLFKQKGDMPDALTAHIRYPVDMLLIQGLVYAKYHMSDPTVFYNQEDLWVRATEKYYNNVQHVEPYYIMWQLPQTDGLEYVLILPFTPKNKQVLIGWIAGMCDPQSYGRLIAYKFPKEKRILGTQQVETKIDQDRHLSGQLTLWDQRGSNVIRGNVLVIPVADTLLYVEPIYLQAETAAYPELRLVVVMHNDNLSYGNTFGDALQGLFGKGRGPAPEGPEIPYRSLVQQAGTAFDDYLKFLGEKRFKDAFDALEKLEQALNSLSNRMEKSTARDIEKAQGG